MTSFAVSSQVHIGDNDRLGTAAFVAAVARRGASHVRRREFPASALSAAEVAPLGEVVLVDTDPHGFDVVLELDSGTVAHVRVARDQGWLAVAARDGDALDDVCSDLVRCFSDPPPAEDLVPMTFWSVTGAGYPSRARRDIASPAWEEIASNYAPSTAAALEPLMRAKRPGSGGLALWHGAPGAGKSYALRALARAWSDWCDTHIVTNPELFFSASTDYLIGSVLRRGVEDRWRVFVVEDAGEYLGADAPALAGQAVSRILNLTDGLLGAGLRSLVLITTNDPLRRVHPALARPGRCWAQVDFEPLPADAANAWLHGHGCDTTVDRATTLADLYALRRGARVVAPSPVGFTGVRTTDVQATQLP